MTVQVEGGDELPHCSIGVIFAVKHDRCKKENWKEMTCDIPGAFMQSDIDKQLFLKFDGDLVELLIQVEPTYQPYITYEGRQPVLCWNSTRPSMGHSKRFFCFGKNCPSS